ncbi:MAG: hypothetical protein JW730_14155 [Anaerolineales bacterium]|nr:hypothetical protein [Anaerolineales bacterium]
MYIGIFNRMLSDDYCSMYQAQRLGLLRSIWFWYRTWHGRFSANVADWLLSLFGSEGFPFHTFIFLILWLGFTTLAVKEVFHFRGYSPSNPFCMLLLGVFLVFTTLGISPDISQSLFWWGGVRSYLSPLILVMLYFALYYHFITSSVDRTRIGVWLFIGFGLAFFTGGFSETFTPILVVLLAGMAGIRWLASKFNRKDASVLFLSAGLLGALCSLIVMVLAPGNSIRQSFFPAPPGIFTILRIASVGYLTFLYDIFSSPTMLTTVLGGTLGAVWLGMSMNRAEGVMAARGWWALVFLLAGFFLAFVCFPPAVYGTSEPPPARALIVSSFFLVLGLLSSGFVFGEWLTGRITDGFPLSSTLFVVACSLIVFSSYHTFQTLYAMRAEHISFAQKWDRVDAEIKEAKKSGLSEIKIPAMKNWAGAQYPTDNPKYYQNICYSKFYDIEISAPPLAP